MTELDWMGPEPDDRNLPPRKCRRHVWYTGSLDLNDPVVTICQSCGKVRDDAATRRGRNNRARGNAIERAVGKELGLKRVGQFGGPTDLVSEPFAVSVKSGSGYFSERYWDQLRRQPVTAGQTPLLVVTDAPGPGHKRRAMVVVDLRDWVQLHGTPAVEE